MCRIVRDMKFLPSRLRRPFSRVCHRTKKAKIEKKPKYFHERSSLGSVKIIGRHIVVKKDAG